MDKDLIKVQLAISERQYVKIYKDFLHNELLSSSEKMVFIALKSFVTYGKDNEEIYPSYDSLCKITSLSRKSVYTAIQDLIKKGIIKKTIRGLTKTNLYTLNDSPTVWNATNIKEMKTISDYKIPLTDEELIEELKRRGTIEIIEKKNSKHPLSPKLRCVKSFNKNYYHMRNDTPKNEQCQPDKYAYEQICEFFDYKTLIEREPGRKDIIDSIMIILHKTINSTKANFKINGEEKSSLTVVSKLMKLMYEDILFVVDRYSEITHEIKNVESYILTMLYNAKEQHSLAIENKVNHDMANWNNKTE